MAARLRVALGTAYPYDEATIRGGVEAVALYLTRALARRDDVELHVVSCSQSAARSHTERRGAGTHHWLTLGRRLYALRAATVDAWRVHRVYQRIRPQVVHAQSWASYAIGAPATVPLLLTIHGFEALSPAMQRSASFRGVAGVYRRAITRWLARTSLAKAGGLVSISGDYGPGLLRPLLGAKPVYHIPNPVDDAWFAVPPGPVGPAGEQVVLSVGDVVERKNALGLVRAFAQVARRSRAARLELAGAAAEPTYLAQVQQEVARLGLQEKVAFLGLLGQRHLAEAYARAAVVVLPSIQETAPMSIQQAMAAARPVVATRVGGVPALVQDGVTGYLTDVGDEEALAERIAELLADRSHQAALGQAARAVARERFAADKVAEATVRAYRELLEGA